jgi:hypothetical protein
MTTTPTRPRAGRAALVAALLLQVFELGVVGVVSVVGPEASRLPIVSLALLLGPTALVGLPLFGVVVHRWVRRPVLSRRDCLKAGALAAVVYHAGLVGPWFVVMVAVDAGTTSRGANAIFFGLVSVRALVHTFWVAPLVTYTVLRHRYRFGLPQGAPHREPATGSRASCCPQHRRRLRRMSPDGLAARSTVEGPCRGAEKVTRRRSP